MVETEMDKRGIRTVNVEIGLWRQLAQLKLDMKMISISETIRALYQNNKKSGGIK